MWQWPTGCFTTCRIAAGRSPSSPERSRQPVASWAATTPPATWESCGRASESTVAADDFDSDNGPAELRRSFRRVEASEAHGEVLWETRERVQTYLDAYHELYGSLTPAPAGPYPLRATRRNVVLVADR